MTESQWLMSGDPAELLEYIESKASRRRVRLFTVACFRQDWNSWSDRRDREAILTAERIADGQADSAECEVAEKALVARIDQLEDLGDIECTPHVPAALLRSDFACWDAIACIGQIEAKADWGPDSFDGCGTEVLSDLANILRDVFGNPFRPVTMDYRLRSCDVLGVARGIYEDRAFDRLPLLADALMDAGCDNDDILAHCRGEGPHVRGCWVVDLVLGKE